MKHLILTVVLLPCIESWGAPWIPPIGVPEPEFGIKEEAGPRPPAWPGAESPGSYYFDSSHPAATDTSNTYGYPNKPRKTIPKNMYVSAGSISEIHGGPYLRIATDYVGLINASTTNPPTKELPAFIRGFDNAEIGVTDEAFATGNSRIEVGRYNLSFVIIENIVFNRISPTIIGMDTHHIAIRNCEVKGKKGSCLGATPFEGGNMHNLVFFNNYLHDTWYWDDVTTDWDYHGISIGLYGRTPATKSHHHWVVDNTFFHCSGDSVQVNANTAGHESLHHVYIGRNKAHANRQSGFWCKQASDVIMSQNTIFNMTQHGPQPGNGIGSQYGPDNLWVIFNEIYDCAYGIRQSDTATGFADHSAYYIGNYIHDLNQLNATAHWGSSSGWAISFWAGGLSRHVVDNTIVNAYGGIEMLASGPVYGRGNIIYNLKPNEYPDTFGTYRSHIECGGDGVNVDFVNCLMYGLQGGASQLARIKWLGKQYTTLSSAQTGLGKLANCIEADPLLDQMRPKANSPAVDAADEPDVYQRFQDLYGINIRKGFDGGGRPLGVRWDLGACEYDASRKAIEAPKGLRGEPLPK